MKSMKFNRSNPFVQEINFSVLLLDAIAKVRETSYARATVIETKSTPLATFETYPDNVEFKRMKQTLKMFALNAPLQTAVILLCNT